MLELSESERKVFYRVHKALSFLLRTEQEELEHAVTLWQANAVWNCIEALGLVDDFYDYRYKLGEWEDKY